MYATQLTPIHTQGQKISDLLLVPSEDIKKLLDWYKDEFSMVREATYADSELTARIRFSQYPFIKGKMPFVSSNLINLAMDQCVLIHMGLMIKYNYIQVGIVDDNGLEKAMTFEDYNRIVGDEFVTAKLEGKYIKPIPPSRKVTVTNEFLGMKRTFSGRYLLKFQTKGEHFFSNKLTVIYPLNLHIVGR